MKAPHQCGAVTVSSAATGGRSTRSGRDCEEARERSTRNGGIRMPGVGRFPNRSGAGTRVGWLARHVPHGVGVAAEL